MAEEIDEAGFYREDFSTESEWEVFNAQLSEIFQDWNLENNNWGCEFEKDEMFNCQWHVETQQLELMQKEIIIKYYSAKVKTKEDVTERAEDEPSEMHKDLMSVLNTFSPTLAEPKTELHILARLFGLRRFVIIRPLKQALKDRSEFCYFLSSAAVVAAETRSSVPIFVQVHDFSWNFYLGVGIVPGFRTNFDVIALEQSPGNCRYLSDLLSMFKEKLPASYARAVTVSVRNTYSLDTISMRIPMQIPFANAPIDDEQAPTGVNSVALSFSQFIALPSGYFPDSCIEIYATYTWPEIAENIAMDTPLRSEFVPSRAPFRSVHQDVHATSYLSSCVLDYQKLSNATELLESYVGKNFTGAVSETDNPLERLTKPRMRHFRMHSKHLAGNQQSVLKKLPGPMTERELEQMLIYLLPPMHPDIALFPYGDKQNAQWFDLHRIKSAQPDSLVSRLSCLLALCHAHFGGKSGLTQLWAAFVRELHVLWDCCLTIPGVAPGYPDTRTCLLHQKFQMLNVCIERRAVRETASGGVASTPASALIESVSSDEEKEEDEFYDCDEEVTAQGVIRPEGREKQLNGKYLLDVNEPIYVPILQEPVPKTEDQLQNEANTMLKMGSGSDISTQMMCSSLLSDMEAFKAANPKARIEDFISWYSPNDWLEETAAENGQIMGKLSARMQSPDNMWQTIWQQAKPVPAWRQKRLFDDTNEALMLLQYLETLSIGEIYELTMLPMLHAAVLKFKNVVNNAQVLDLFEQKINAVLADICRWSHDIEFVSQLDGAAKIQMPDPMHIIEQLQQLEMQFYQLKCLQRMCGYPELIDLQELKQQFTTLLEQGGTLSQLQKSENSNEDIVHKLVSPEIIKNELREKLISKEYVLRVDGKTDSSKGTTGAQFLRAIITGEKLRLCGAFTDSTVFV